MILRGPGVILRGPVLQALGAGALFRCERGRDITEPRRGHGTRNWSTDVAYTSEYSGASGGRGADGRKCERAYIQHHRGNVLLALLPGDSSFWAPEPKL